MSSLNIMHPDQYKDLYDLPQEDQKILYDGLTADRDKLVDITKRYPVELTYRSKTYPKYGFRAVVSSAAGYDFILMALKIMIDEA
jgi:hypothetical protein